MRRTFDISLIKRLLPAGSAKAIAGTGRILLVLTVLLLVTTPLTQHVWTWDHFLRGGQDYESSALLILTFLSLVLVLGQHCKQRVSTFFAALRGLLPIVCDPLLVGFGLSGALTLSFSRHRECPRLVSYSRPLQI